MIGQSSLQTGSRKVTRVTVPRSLDITTVPPVWSVSVNSGASRWGMRVTPPLLSASTADASGGPSSVPSSSRGTSSTAPTPTVPRLALTGRLRSSGAVRPVASVRPVAYDGQPGQLAASTTASGSAVLGSVASAPRTPKSWASHQVTRHTVIPAVTKAEAEESEVDADERSKPAPTVTRMTTTVALTTTGWLCAS